MQGPCVVFVHGLGGTCVDTWGPMSQLLSGDPTATHRQYFFEYHSEKVRWKVWKNLKTRAPSIQDIANGLGTFLRNEVIPKDHSEIILVAHSLGGVVCKLYLLDSSCEEATASIPISRALLYAPPNNGSHLAPLADTLSFDNRTVSQLIPDSDYLAHLKTRWDTYARTAPVCVRYVVGDCDNVVPPNSVQYGAANTDIDTVSGADHSSVVRVAHRGALPYIILHRFLTEPPKPSLVPQQARWSARQKRQIHYIAPAGAESEFFNRFHASVATVLSKRPDEIFRYHDPGEDQLTKAAEMIACAPRPDAIILPPTHWEDSPAQTVIALEHAIRKHESRRVVFVDREPPERLLRLPNTSFIGINNRRVGVMAGVLLFEALAKIKAPRAYFIIDGPGGPLRASWVNRTLAGIDPQSSRETVKIEDLPRTKTEARAARMAESFKTSHPGMTIGIFAGNDETATSFCHQALEEEWADVVIVGCDATREMRRWVDNPRGRAVATMENRMHDWKHVDRVIEATRTRVILPLDPEAYIDPNAVAHDFFRRSRAYQDLWEDATCPIA